MDHVKEQLAFKRTDDYKGYNISAWYLESPNNGNALIEIFKDGEIVRKFLFPAYKIYNLQAHFEDIVESEINNNTHGYEEAASSGLGGSVPIIPV